MYDKWNLDILYIQSLIQDIQLNTTGYTLQSTIFLWCVILLYTVW